MATPFIKNMEIFSDTLPRETSSQVELIAKWLTFIRNKYGQTDFDTVPRIDESHNTLYRKILKVYNRAGLI